MKTAYECAGILICYHELEELFIVLLCFIIALRTYKDHSLFSDNEKIERSRLFASGFLLLGVSSLIHLLIHVLNLNTNLLYQSLLGYCFSFLIIIASLSAETVHNKEWLPLAYFPLFLLLSPAINKDFPLFVQFRPVAWISVSYLAGVVCVLYCTVYYAVRNRRLLSVITGFFLICLSSSLLFFPAAIGSPVWLAGHALRPIGFLLVFFGIAFGEINILGGSILYRALTAFSLLAGLPLLIFGTLVFYENMSPINILDQQWILFLLLGVTLASALLFGLGMIIRLIRPILDLKEGVEHIVDAGLQKRIQVGSNDEIGELAESFNRMMGRLCNAIDEQERMCRLAATGELAATLAHEIKNPLNAIGGAASYIGRNYRGELIKEFIKIITDEVKRINQLTLTLLNFAKPLVPAPMPTDINKLVRETLFLMEQEANENSIAITSQFSEDLPPAFCDRNQIRQILLNLMINAFDAVQELNGAVTVETRKKDKAIHVLVRDNGKGIAKEMIREIFNPFFTTKTRGTGLGLAISKKIAKEHGGDLRVQSSSRGTVFTLILQGAS
ncbi:MAG: ATP-binding protein [Deltaproteobacteria bacterium]